MRGGISGVAIAWGGIVVCAACSSSEPPPPPPPMHGNVEGRSVADLRGCIWSGFEGTNGNYVTAVSFLFADKYPAPPPGPQERNASKWNRANTTFVGVAVVLPTLTPTMSPGPYVIDGASVTSAFRATDSACEPVANEAAVSGRLVLDSLSGVAGSKATGSVSLVFPHGTVEGSFVADVYCSFGVDDTDPECAL